MQIWKCKFIRSQGGRSAEEANWLRFIRIPSVETTFWSGFAKIRQCHAIFLVKYCNLPGSIVKGANRLMQIQIKVQKRFIETHRHIQQWYIRSLYNSKHCPERVPVGTPRDNSATITSKRRCDVVPTQNDDTMTPRVHREWHVIYKGISNSTWITCVSMKVNRTPQAYTAFIVMLDLTQTAMYVGPTLAQPQANSHRCPRIVFPTGYAT